MGSLHHWRSTVPLRRAESVFRRAQKRARKSCLPVVQVDGFPERIISRPERPAFRVELEGRRRQLRSHCQSVVARHSVVQSMAIVVESTRKKNSPRH